MLGTALISGFGLGSIYGLIALGFTLTFSVSGTVNFAQGSSVMLGAVLCHALFVGMHWPFAPAALLALLGCALWGLAGLVHLGMQRTAIGLKLRAAVDNPNAARLMSIDVTRLIALTFAAAALLAGIGGILVAPLFNVAYDMGTLFGIKAFAVAILGGLTNPWGVVIAGLAYGLVEAFATTWLGSSSTQIVTFAAVIAALALAPSGIFGGKTLAR